MPKRTPIRVSGKLPSDDAVAALLGISGRRQKELDRMVEEYFRQKHGSTSSTPRNGRNGRKRLGAR